MSDAVERAREWIDRWDISMAKAKDIGLGLWPEDTKECYDTITDLLAEVERLKVESNNKYTTEEGVGIYEKARQQAAREAVEICERAAYEQNIDTDYGTGKLHAFDSVEYEIKKHFGLEAQND